MYHVVLLRFFQFIQDRQIISSFLYDSVTRHLNRHLLSSHIFLYSYNHSHLCTSITSLIKKYLSWISLDQSVITSLVDSTRLNSHRSAQWVVPQGEFDPETMYTSDSMIGNCILNAENRFTEPESYRVSNYYTVYIENQCSHDCEYLTIFYSFFKAP